MTSEDRQRAREEINARPFYDFVPLEKSKGVNMYNCPICGSGTGIHKTGALKIENKGGKWKAQCFARDCFKGSQDTLGALRIFWNTDERETMERAGVLTGSDVRRPAPRQNTEKEAAPVVYDFSEDFTKWHENLKNSEEARAYLLRRGISEDTAARFNLGYCEAWNHPASPKKYKSKRIIIPASKNTYLARKIDGAADDQYKKQIVGSGKTLFNSEALEAAEVVFICEGEFDAMSFCQASAAAVSIGSIGNWQAFLEAAKGHPNIIYFAALDNDNKEDGRNPGAETQEKLVKAMEAAGLFVISCDAQKLYIGEKDANDAFVKHPTEFKNIVQRSIIKGLEIREEKKIEAAEKENYRRGGMIDAFLSEIQTRRFEPIPTGVDELNKAIGGGFIRNTLVTLGAAPGMGKTAIAQWIFENMAKAGTDVLYINLEMDRNQLIARSIARTAYEHEPPLGDFSTTDILRGYQWTPKDYKAITYAADIYKREIAQHFMYNPDGVTNDLSSILKACKEEANRLRAIDRPAPLVCIDYLQLVNYDMLDPGERKPDATEGIKRTLAALKSFALEYNTIVMLIIAHNRASNKEGRATMESGRDTSTIEYTGDLMLGLSYTAIEDGEAIPTEDGKRAGAVDLDYILGEVARAKREGRPRPDIANRVCLKILKSRFSEAGSLARFIFDGKHNTFKEIPGATYRR